MDISGAVSPDQLAGAGGLGQLLHHLQNVSFCPTHFTLFCPTHHTLFCPTHHTLFCPTHLTLFCPTHLLPHPPHLQQSSCRLTMSRIQLVSMLDSSQEALRVCREALHAHQQPEGDLPKIVIGSSSEDESLASSERLSPQVGFSSECCAWLWCKTAEIFLMCGQLKDAANSLKEAQQITPDSIQVLLLVSESPLPPSTHTTHATHTTYTHSHTRPYLHTHIIYMYTGVPSHNPTPTPERPFV